jgi:superfamily II DNA or RNA helicase
MGYVTDELDAEAPHLTLQRGRDYFLRGRVREIDGEEHWVEAIVQGSERYEVELNVIDGSVDYSCSCPYYVREFDLCKHIWAAALAAEARGLLSDLRYHEHAAIRRAENGRKANVGQKARKATWKDSIRAVKRLLDEGQNETKENAATERELLYVIDADKAAAAQGLIVEVSCRERKIDGNWGKIKSLRLYPNEIAGFKEPSDQQIVSILLGARQDTGYGYSSYHYNSSSQFGVPKALWEVLLPVVCATGRCRFRASRQAAPVPLRWDDGAAWELCIDVSLDEKSGRYVLTGKLRRDGAELSVTEPELLLAGGLVFHKGVVARLEDHGAFAWVSLLRQRLAVEFGKSESEAFLDELLRLPRQPRLVLPDEFKYEVVSQPPQPHLVIKRGEKRPWGEARLIGELSFDYGGELIPHERPGITVYKKDQRQLVKRDLIAETAAKQKLFAAGFRTSYWSKDQSDIAPAQLPRVVRLLTAEGWHVEAEGSLYRTANSISMEVSSGVDWFELGGAVHFGDARIALPRLLRAIKQGEQTIRLDDGTFGVVPEEWIKKYGLLAGVAGASGDKLRFSRPQAGLLDALLASEPEVRVDAVFERVRQELRDFSGVRDAEPTAEFCGALRSYQRDGLGWLNFLQRFGFGGCLADDMGLGKTIQVLALLESRRELRCAAADPAPPSLVVVPRSLVFHWKAEAARFTPKLRVLDHTGAARLKPGDHFEDYDVILTTYGTLRRDAMGLKDQQFDYCVLDEAQAIKNAGTLSAKAARLIKADHRLAMSGTPVENHLGELWSLFEFLNPGMLGAASVLGNAGRNPDPATRAVLARALRPFILRRTKGQVATELPEKTEQTIYCDLEGKQRKYYDELRDFYRARLLKGNVDEQSGQYKIQVLEALLRLRQAACHPGLIDKKKTVEPSSKIDTLLAQLDQVTEEDHKALVFSQFTSFLAILRSHLDAQGIPYAYLDGRTRDREARVMEFQNDPKIKLFLISLKAGGLGLNLHAAEYVYLLDPWWNPAVEMQAIDRAHRIGQTRHVFAYRLIARDTVEEKVLELQKSKRDLADAIITADNSMMRNLTRGDLELLLS